MYFCKFCKKDFECEDKLSNHSKTLYCKKYKNILFLCNICKFETKSLKK